MPVEVRIVRDAEGFPAIQTALPVVGEDGNRSILHLYGSMSESQFSASIYDRMAPKLGQLEKCGMEPIQFNDDLVERFWKKDILIGGYEPDVRPLYLHDVRNVNRACRTYNVARTALEEYISGNPPQLRMYVRAIDALEECVHSMCSAELCAATLAKQLAYEQSSDSVWERICGMSDHLRHWFPRIGRAGNLDETKRLPMTLPIWISNEGVECRTKEGRDIEVKFAELQSELEQMCDRIGQLV